MSPRKIVGPRRAAFELKAERIVNLGKSAMPRRGLRRWANEKRVLNTSPLNGQSLEIMEGFRGAGLNFGAAINIDALIGRALSVDYYAGGALDIAFWVCGRKTRKGT